jgi:hypothetical protein
MLHTQMSRARMRNFVVLALRGAVLVRSLHRVLTLKQRELLGLLDTNEAGRNSKQNTSLLERCVACYFDSFT